MFLPILATTAILSAPSFVLARDAEPFEHSFGALEASAPTYLALSAGSRNKRRDDDDNSDNDGDDDDDGVDSLRPDPLVDSNRAKAAALQAESDTVANDLVNLRAELDRAQARHQAVPLELAASRALLSRSGARMSEPVRAQLAREIRDLAQEQGQTQNRIDRAQRALVGNRPGEGSWLNDRQENLFNQRAALDVEYLGLLGQAPVSDADPYPIDYFIARVDDRLDLAVSQRDRASAASGDTNQRAMLAAAAQAASLAADKRELIAMRDTAARALPAGSALTFTDVLDVLFEGAQGPDSFSLGAMNTADEIETANARYRELAGQVRAATSSLRDLERTVRLQQRLLNEEAADTRDLARGEQGSERTRLMAEVDRLNKLADALEARADNASLQATTLRNRLAGSATALDRSRERIDALTGNTSREIFLGQLDDLLDDFDDAEDTVVAAPRRRTAISFFDGSVVSADGKRVIFFGDLANDPDFSDALDDDEGQDNGPDNGPDDPAFADAIADDAPEQDAEAEGVAVFSTYDVNQVVVQGATPQEDLVLRQVEIVQQDVEDAQPQLVWAAVREAPVPGQAEIVQNDTVTEPQATLWEVVENGVTRTDLQIREVSIVGNNAAAETDPVFEITEIASARAVLARSFAMAMAAYRDALETEARELGIPTEGETAALAQAVITARKARNAELESELLYWLDALNQAMAADAGEVADVALDRFELLSTERADNLRRVADLERELDSL